MNQEPNVAGIVAAIQERTAQRRCERVIDGGDQCARMAAGEFDGDFLCHEHGQQEEY